MPIVFKVNNEKNFGHIDFWRLISLKNLLKYKSKEEKKVYFLSFIAHIALKQKSDIDTSLLYGLLPCLLYLQSVLRKFALFLLKED